MNKIEKIIQESKAKLAEQYLEIKLLEAALEDDPDLDLGEPADSTSEPKEKKSSFRDKVETAKEVLKTAGLGAGLTGAGLLAYKKYKDYSHPYNKMIRAYQSEVKNRKARELARAYPDIIKDVRSDLRWR